MIDFREDEVALYEVRKHWFIIGTELFSLVLLGFLPLLIPQILDLLSVQLHLSIEGQTFWPIYIFFYSFWLLFLWILGFTFWTNYYLDVWIITNEKIIDVDQIGLFSREISILHLDKIQDVTTEVHGLIGTVLRFGDLHVQTAGQQREFVIKGISDPSEFSEKLNEVLMKYGNSRNNLD